MPQSVQPRHIKGGRGGTLTPFTPETSRLASQAREEKRRRLYAEGAQLAVEDVGLVKRYGEDAHIVARARTLQQIAETPDAGKAAVMAAGHLDKAQGLADRDTGDAAGSRQLSLPPVLLLIAELGKRGIGGEVIDAQAVDDE